MKCLAITSQSYENRSYLCKHASDKSNTHSISVSSRSIVCRRIRSIVYMFFQLILLFYTKKRIFWNWSKNLLQFFQKILWIFLDFWFSKNVIFFPPLVLHVKNRALDSSLRYRQTVRLITSNRVDSGRSLQLPGTGYCWSDCMIHTRVVLYIHPWMYCKIMNHNRFKILFAIILYYRYPLAYVRSHINSIMYSGAGTIAGIGPHDFFVKKILISLVYYICVYIFEI